MSFLAYPEYKDSGIEWLGEVPAGWTVTALKRSIPFQTGGTPATGNEDFYGGDDIWVTIGDMQKKEVGSSKTMLTTAGINAASIPITPSGSLLFSFKLSVGQVAFASVDLYTNEAIASFLPNDVFDLGYGYYALPHFVVQNATENIYGAKLLNRTRIENAPICVPSYSEQCAITAFLDRETAKIDAAVAAQERLIALLAEKRAATISHAVTKGLDPDAPMKDSGIEWLGQIPAHWDVKRLRHLARLNPSKSELDRHANEVVSFLPMEAIGERGTLDLTSTRRVGEVASGYTYFAENDVTVAKITPCFENGKGALMRGLQGEIGFGTTELIVVRPGDKIRPAFLKLVCDTAEFRRLGEGWMYGAGGQKRVPDAFVENFAVATPTVTEQDKIVAEVERRMQDFDKLEERARGSIELMRERRAALISAAVTGKIDVRGEVEAHQQEAA